MPDTEPTVEALFDRGGAYAFIEVTEPPHRLLRTLYLRAYGDGARSERSLAAHPLLTVERRSHFFGCATSFTGRRVDERSR